MFVFNLYTLLYNIILFKNGECISDALAVKEVPDAAGEKNTTRNYLDGVLNIPYLIVKVICFPVFFLH